MKKVLSILALAALVLTSASCGKSRAEQMAMADNVVITCNPEVLTLVGDKIPCKVTVTYPEGYFHPQAYLVVTPVLVYEGGTQTAPAAKLQGEKVKDNYAVVPKAGGSITQVFDFDYVPGVENSYLELQSVAYYGDKAIEIPAVKVAQGVNTTARLVNVAGTYNFKEDGYQAVLHKTAEGQIMYDVNSANVKKSELRSESIKALQEALGQIAADERSTVTETKIIAYASPEGGQKLNAELSDKRADSAEKAWSKISKDGAKADDVQIQSVGQDWEGFQEAVANSNLKDKDLILRVLSMYSDPAVRESEIRNMSQVFTEMNKTVFPELRRARFVTNYDFQNFTDAELEELAASAVNVLDEPALLRVAANSDDFARKCQLYKLAEQKYDSEKAIFNLAALYLGNNEPAVAQTYLNKLSENDPDVINAKGVAALQSGLYDKAAEFFKKAGTPESKANLGAIDILKGDYESAVAALKDDKGTNKALANILAGNLNAAANALTGEDALTDYLKAIIAARRGEVKEALKNIASATAKDPAFGTRAAKDIEFAKCR